MCFRARPLALAALIGTLALTGGLLAQETVEGQQQSREQPVRPQVEAPPPPDGIEGFGAVDWGMSTDEVLRYFPDAEPGEGGGLHISLAIGGKPSEAYFVFRDDKLAIIAGRFTQRYSNLNDYIHEYDEVVTLLERQLLEANLTEEKWADDGLEQDDDEKGRAVATGRLRLRTRWETPKSYVDFTCTGGNYQVHRTIRFQSREFGGPIRKPQSGS
jgi:hypothetical protein